MKFICNYTINDDCTHLTVHVSDIGINAFKADVYPLLKEKNRCKSYYNLLKLFVFIRWMSQEGFLHVSKEHLAEIAFSGHKDRFEDALKILEQLNYVKAIINRKQPCGIYYTYESVNPNYTEVYPSNNTTAFEFDIPGLTSIYLMKHRRSVRRQFKSESLETNIVVNNPEITSSNKQLSPFGSQFVQWYDELFIYGSRTKPGHFSTEDGRFYHKFHQLSKDERKNNVLWDGQHVVEVWDAHSAFFIVLGFHLLKERVYASEKEREAFTKEAKKLVDLCVSKDLYKEVANFHNSHSAANERKYKRDTIKTLIQCYKSLSRQYLFRKDGRLKKHWYCQRYKYIDQFFAEEFPNIRDFILDYPKREKHAYKWGSLYSLYSRPENSIKIVSNLQRDVMPGEFKLISEGVCKLLYDQYNIKSITVHDAIYVKQNDVLFVDMKTIDNLLKQVIFNELPAKTRHSIDLLEGIAS